jgi:hypothetical protein
MVSEAGTTAVPALVVDDDAVRVGKVCDLVCPGAHLLRVAVQRDDGRTGLWTEGADVETSAIGRRHVDRAPASGQGDDFGRLHSARRLRNQARSAIRPHRSTRVEPDVATRPAVNPIA